MPLMLLEKEARSQKLLTVDTDIMVLAIAYVDMLGVQDLLIAFGT